MRIRIAAVTLAGLALSGTACAEAKPMKDPRPPRSTELPLPQDGDIAVRGELEAARQAGTIAAYDLFLARHPEHKLAEIARREREALRKAGP